MTNTESRGGPDDPHEWLNRAKSNIEMARAAGNLSNVYWEDPCFEAQQAAEKAIKAVLIHLAIRFPYTHDLTALLRLLESRGCSIPDNVKQAGSLTRFAVATRYPGLTETVTREEYEKALASAEVLLEWAEKEVEKRPDIQGG